MPIKTDHRIGAFPVYGHGQTVSQFVTVEYQDGRLSITGVHGPISNGNCRGSAGQCDSEIREALAAGSIIFAKGWNAATLSRLLDIWHDWHLNDMRPYDDAMLRDGWREIAATPMLGYKFSLASATWQEKRAAEKRALESLASGKAHRPAKRESHIAALPLSYVQWIREGEQEPAALPDYERSRAISGYNSGGIESPERKTLGWLKPSEHPDGLLTRVHPESGNGYGSKWYSSPVPHSDLAFLASLPLADRASPCG